MSRKLKIRHGVYGVIEVRKREYRNIVTRALSLVVSDSKPAQVEYHGGMLRIYADIGLASTDVYHLAMILDAVEIKLDDQRVRRAVRAVIARYAGIAKKDSDTKEVLTRFKQALVSQSIFSQSPR